MPRNGPWKRDIVALDSVEGLSPMVGAISRTTPWKGFKQAQPFPGEISILSDWELEVA